MNARRGQWVTILSVLALGWSGIVCSATKDGSAFGNTDGTGGSGTTNGAGGDTSGSGGNILGQGGSLLNDGGVPSALAIKPADSTVTYTGAPLTVQFEADFEGKPTAAVWSLDRADLGAIDANGLFTASGTAGGLGHVTAQFGKLLASTTLTIALQITENTGNLSQADQDKLKDGGAADPAFKWLYPYDKTVFPRGLAGPTLQFAGGGADGVYVHAGTKSQSIVYSGYFAGSTPTRVEFSASTWKALTNSVAAGEDLIVNVSKIQGGQVAGPITEHWRIAPGSLKGTVYYNSYDSQLAGNIGAVLRLKPGEQAQILVGGNGKCTVCHTVSAHGNVMLASNDTYTTGAVYDLLANGAQSKERSDHAYNFPAVTPDGALALSTAGDKIGGMWNSDTSQLFDVASGSQISAPGFDGIVQHAATPAFSPDGTRLAFNDEDQGNVLAVMAFDQGTKTFSNLVPVANDQPDNLLGWPSFLPDSKGIVVDAHLGQSTVGTQPNYGTWGAQRSNLKLADVQSKTVTPLDLLNGYDGGNLYLPFGADDEKRDFEPNVLPVAVGGYYWVVFTSRRQYGNTINTPESGAYGDTKRKKLWVAAIDIDWKPGQDPSHPAFYLPGQEDASGNMRGFWVLDPCRQDGQSCESGDECCNGYCRQVNDADGGSARACVPPPNGCAQEFEKCVTAADCCNAAQGYLCINDHCALPPPK
jgi:hypothetical protein